jgi:hypothetical protein
MNTRQTIARVLTLTVAMQRLCDAARWGYVCYFEGVVPASKATRLRRSSRNSSTWTSIETFARGGVVAVRRPPS